MDKKNLRILLQEEELLETDLTTEEMHLIVSITTMRDLRTIKTILLINLMIVCVGILFFLLN